MAHGGDADLTRINDSSSATAKPGKFAWSDVFHVELDGRQFMCGRRPGQTKFSTRFEFQRRTILRSLDTGDRKTAAKNALNLIRKVVRRDWDAVDEMSAKKARGPSGAALADEYIVKMEGLSKSHAAKGRCIIRRFVADVVRARSLEDVTPREIDAWLDKIENTNSRNGYFGYTRAFFNWAEKLDIIQKNPMAKMDAPPTQPARNILTISQMQEILRAGPNMERGMFAAFLMAAFAGLRTAEIARMNWEDIDLDREQIDVRHAKAKPGDFGERMVDFTEPLQRRKEWLTGTGKITFGDDQDLSRARLPIVKVLLRWPEWPSNCLRHSFATYHLARCLNPSLTAYQMGHTSPQMVRKVYAVPARRVVADEWWAL